MFSLDFSVYLIVLSSIKPCNWFWCWWSVTHCVLMHLDGEGKKHILYIHNNSACCCCRSSIIDKDKWASSTSSHKSLTRTHTPAFWIAFLVCSVFFHLWLKLLLVHSVLWSWCTGMFSLCFILVMTLITDTDTSWFVFMLKETSSTHLQWTLGFFFRSTVYCELMM